MEGMIFGSEAQMPNDSPVRVGIVFCLVIVHILTVRTAESAIDEGFSDPVAAKLDNLGTEYERLQREQLQSIPPDGAKESDSKISDVEWQRRARELQAKFPSPDSILLSHFFALAKAHPESPFALDALAFVIRVGGYHNGDVRGESWRIKEQAIDVVMEHHLNDPRVVHVFKLLSGGLPSQKSEAFLRQVFEHSHDRTRRAAAGYYLARYLHNLRHVDRRNKQIKNQSKLANSERFWKIVVTPYLDEGFRYDEAKVSAEIVPLLAEVIEEYSDVPAMDWKWSGPSQVFLRSEAFPQPTTYGDLAKSLLFEVNHLIPGKQAPEIEGKDAAGATFRLSDYRGKVVLLTFSANWCGGCVELYPLQRNLVDKYRDEPFVLLSVSRDESIETLASATASGEITWRCWWDGMRGPIYGGWNKPGAPTIYLLDHQGIIQDVNLNRATPQTEFEQAIAPLLSKAVATD